MIDFSQSTFDSDSYTKQINSALKDIPQEFVLTQLMRWTITLATINVDRHEGGPFAALLVDLERRTVVGMGTNHVIPLYDPTAHAEITAIRDTAKRLGKTDLSGLTLVTSCECCPMCLAASIGTSIDKIYYAATRHDAASAGFSDAYQYELIASPIETQALLAPPADVPNLENLLAGHSAAVVTDDMTIFLGEHYHTDDPTALASMQAIQAACSALHCFHLPENTHLITREKPHPMTLIAADWAHIGRLRDRLGKDPHKILYLHDHVETMKLRNDDGLIRSIDGDTVLNLIKSTIFPIEQILGFDLEAIIPFTKWRDALKLGTPSY